MFSNNKKYIVSEPKEINMGNEKLHGVPPILLPNLFYSECINRKREEKIYIGIFELITKYNAL